MLRLGSVCRGFHRLIFVDGDVHPDQLVDAPDGGWLEQAIGGWTRVRLISVQLGQSPLRASPRSSHPNRFVWKWVEVGPLRFWHGQRRSLRVGFDFADSPGSLKSMGRHLITGFESRREMGTFVPSGKNIDRKWFVVDANGQTLGRLATKAASVLSGKLIFPSLPPYRPRPQVLLELSTGVNLRWIGCNHQVLFRVDRMVGRDSHRVCEMVKL